MTRAASAARASPGDSGARLWLRTWRAARRASSAFRRPDEAAIRGSTAAGCRFPAQAQDRKPSPRPPRPRRPRSDLDGRDGERPHPAGWTVPGLAPSVWASEESYSALLVSQGVHGQLLQWSPRSPGRTSAWPRVRGPPDRLDVVVVQGVTIASKVSVSSRLSP